jgi:copper resistance protein D
MPSWISIAFVVARAVHFTAALLLFGAWGIDRLVIRADDTYTDDARWRRVRRVAVLSAIPAALVSGAAWFALVTIDMTDLPLREALTAANLHLVWTQTDFGRLWQWRGVVMIAIVIAQLIRPRALRAWAQLALTATFLASLAVAGHGRVGRPVSLHIAADAVHLLIAGLWPSGLVFFAMLLRSVDEKRILRFSKLCLISVLLLLITGVIESCYLLQRPSDLFRSRYGEVLLAKILCFIALVALGAVNRISVIPKLRSDPGRRAMLRQTVCAEILLGIAVVVLVAVLGVLAPPNA